MFVRRGVLQDSRLTDYLDHHLHYGEQSLSGGDQIDLQTRLKRQLLRPSVGKQSRPTNYTYYPLALSGGHQSARQSTPYNV